MLRSGQMSRKDPVTPDLYERVVRRELRVVLEAMVERGVSPVLGPIPKWRPWPPAGLCVAWVLDPSEKCWGGWTLDHVRDQPMMGKRAPSDERHLVALCSLHHQGMNDKGGRIWATANRPVLREYLQWVNDDAGA